MFVNRTVLDRRGNVSLVRETLSDGSYAYDVILGQCDVIIHAIDDKDAMEIFRFLSPKSITVTTN